MMKRMDLRDQVGNCGGFFCFLLFYIENDVIEDKVRNQAHQEIIPSIQSDIIKSNTTMQYTFSQTKVNSPLTRPSSNLKLK